MDEAAQEAPEVAGFEVEGRLGSGAFGEVWRARSLATRQAVAIKVSRAADPQAAELAMHEDRLLQRLQHPGVVRSLGALRLADGRVALIHELLDGPVLAEALRAGRVFGEAEALALARALLGALGAIHAAGYVHRDVSPSNIVMTARGPVLTDLGVAGRREEAMGGLTLPGQFVGKVAYMSPEQATGRPQSPRTDLWGAALVVGEALTGRPMLGAAAGEAPHALIRRLLEADFDFSGCPPSFLPFLRGCLRRDEADRPETAAAAAELLPTGAPGAPRAAPRPPPPQPAASRGRRLVWATALALVALLSAAGLGLFWFGGEPPLMQNSPDAGWGAGSAAPGPGDVPLRALSLIGAGAALALLGAGGAALVGRRAERARDDLRLSVAEAMNAPDPRLWLSRTMMVEIGEYQAMARSPGDRVLAVALAAATLDWGRAAGPEDARKAMEHLVEMHDRVAARLRPWWLDYDRLIARGVAATTFAGGAIAVVEGVRALF